MTRATHYDYYLCDMGEEVRKFQCKTDAIAFAVKGNPDRLARQWMRYGDYILYVNPEEGTCRDVTEDLALAWWAEAEPDADIPEVFAPYLETEQYSEHSDRQEHGTYSRGIGM